MATGTNLLILFKQAYFEVNTAAQEKLPTWINAFLLSIFVNVQSCVFKLFCRLECIIINLASLEKFILNWTGYSNANLKW